jgi:glutathione transport system ATP-binding protein
MSHRVAVLDLGQIMELGSRQQVFETPSHDYTKRLLSAVPIADPSARTNRPALEGEIPSTTRRIDDKPPIYRHREVATGHFVAETA